MCTIDVEARLVGADGRTIEEGGRMRGRESEFVGCRWGVGEDKQMKDEQVDGCMD